MISATLVGELRQCLAEPVLTGDELTPYTRDFSRLRTVTPAAVVRVRSEAELTDVLRRTSDTETRVTIRASGLSSNGRCLGEGVIIVQVPVSGDWSVRGDEVEVAARTPWSALVDMLKSHYLAPPVVTYSLDTTIGGTLSVGGFGPASVRHGAQVDHVRRLRLILPSGEPIWCESGEELFRCALGGMGQIGVIERVVLGLVPYRPLIRVETQTSLDVPDCDLFFVDDGRATVGYDLNASEAFLGGNLSTLSREHLHASRPGARDGYVHLWCDYFLPPHAIEAFLAIPLEPSGLDLVHVLAIAPGRPDRAYQPLAKSEMPRDHFFGVGVFYSLPGDDLPGIDAARDVQRRLLHECLRLGGRPYLSGAHDLTESDLGAIFGEEHHSLVRLRDYLDPGALFNRLG